MAFSDLALKAASESAVIAAHKNLAKLNMFAKNFSELQGVPGKSIAVPVYALSAAAAFTSENNYASGANEVGGELITLDQHLVKAVSITDVEEAETGIRWAADTSYAVTDMLTRGVNDYVFGLINSTNVPLSTETNLSSKSVIANLYAVAENNDIPVDRSIVALKPTQFAGVLGQLDSCVYGGSEAIRLGVIEGLYGFKAFVCAPNLPEGVNGAIICDTAVGVASRYLFPGTEGAYPQAWSATDDNGFTIGFRRFMDLATGSNKFAGDVLFGAKILQPTKIVRLG